MELVDLSRKYQEFYTPAFSILMGGSDLLRDLKVAVSQLEVDLPLGGAARFSFTIADSYSHKDRIFQTSTGRDLLNTLSFGTKLDISMGYGDSKSMVLMLKGMVTEISTTFPDGGVPELAIAGYDYGFPLTVGKSSRTWTKKLDSFAVEEIAGFHNLNAKIEPTRTLQDQIEQNQVSDWDFLKTLADRNHYELYIDERGTLHFANPKNKDSAIVNLNYGGGLLSFKPEANLAGQIARVEVYGWNIQQKKEFIGIATTGEESGLNGKSGGQQLKQFVRDPRKLPTLRIRQPVFSQAEANERARAALNENAQKFLTGEGECIGLPEIRPDRNVQLGNLGKQFSKTYYIQQATHKIDSSGYRTRFKVKETGL